MMFIMHLRKKDIEIELVFHIANLIKPDSSKKGKTSANAEVFPFVAPLREERCSNQELAKIATNWNSINNLCLLELTYQ